MGLLAECNSLVDASFGVSRYAQSLKGPLTKTVTFMKNFYLEFKCPNKDTFKLRSHKRETTPCGQLSAFMNDFKGWVNTNLADCSNRKAYGKDYRQKKMINRFDRYQKDINTKCTK